MDTLQSAASKGREIDSIRSESDLAALSALLIGRRTPARAAANWSPAALEKIRTKIRCGHDPLGETFSILRSAEARRATGAVYTPAPIVASMIKWAASEDAPARIVDPGTGSGRFLFVAARKFPHAELVAVETDPLAILMLRANATVLGVTDRLTVIESDYRAIKLPPVDGPTLFIGNPPYVRHHDIPEKWKDWLARTATAYGFTASKLAGLHVHFFLKTRELAKAGDYGAFITSAEWLDVNYGSLLRKLLADGLGGAALHVLPPETMPFADTATTGAITCFRVGRRTATLTLRSVESFGDLNGLAAGKAVPWSKLESATRWTPFLRAAKRSDPDHIELGEICAVHRGQVTGANPVWIAGSYPGPLPAKLLIPTVTKARELIRAGLELKSAAKLRRVINLPAVLETLSMADQLEVQRFLLWARKQGAHQGYMAKQRAAWWAVKLYDPAPILCTYMARRPPVFVRNLCGARHLNIAHGLYPREKVSPQILTALAAWLNANVGVESGRTYAGGLTKFEPKEIERIRIPRLDRLDGGTESLDARRIGGRRRDGDGHISRGTA